MTRLLLLLAAATLKATAILVLAALVAWLMRHRTAASRHLVWTAALGSSIGVFAFSSVLPAWRVIPLPATPVAVDAAAFVLPPLPAPRRQAKESVRLSSSGARESGARVPAPLPSNAPVWPTALLLIWAAGAAALASRNIAGRLALHRVRRTPSGWVESDAIVRRLAGDMGISRKVLVSCSEDAEVPITWGVFRPQIMLPSDVLDWSPACRRHVLQHELAHVSRCDAATQSIAELAAILFWFHPLVWHAVSRMRAERERACDDRVLACGAVASDYATELLTFVTHRGFVAPHAIALGFAERSKFEQRLEALLDPSVARGTLSPIRVALVVGVSLLVTVPLAAMQRTVAGSARFVVPLARAIVVQPTPMSAPPRGMPVAARATFAEPPRSIPADTAHLADAFAGCAMRVTGQHSNGRMDGDDTASWTASGGNVDCQYRLASAGTVLLNGDATAIDRISAGGYLDVSTSIRGDLTRLIARASAAGDVSYDFSQNGRPLEFSGAARSWLNQFFLCLDRTTAFAIERRFPLLLNAGGPDNVLAEIDQMHSDHAISTYLVRLIQATTLDTSAVRRIAVLASRISAQHMAGEVILAAATRQHLTDEARDLFMRRADSISESSMRLRAVAALTQAR